MERAHRIILPGVGHFGQLTRALDALGVRDALVDRIRAGIPFMGICLGLQAMFEASEEAPGERGLGIFPGKVRRFQGDMRILTWAGTISRASAKAACCAPPATSLTSTSRTAITARWSPKPPPPARTP